MSGFWLVIGGFIAFIVLMTWVGASFSKRPRRPDYVDPEDRPLF